MQSPQVLYLNNVVFLIVGLPSNYVTCVYFTTSDQVTGF